MSKVFQPVGQKRLTNIAVVRYKKHGKRFEIACYKNKVLNWRNGIEKDLDEVLQSTTVFSNVSKGILAKKEDMVEVFGTADEEAVCLKILAEGELQVSDKERKVELDTLFRDVASIISEKCINPETNRPYTISMIERALRDVHFSADAKRSAKAQALEALPLLQSQFPIQRARMRLKLAVPLSSKDELEELLARQGGVVEERDLALGGGHLSSVCLVEPGVFRELHSFVQGCTGQIEVLSLAATAEEAGGAEAAARGVVDLSLGSVSSQAQQQHAPREGPAAVAEPSPPAAMGSGFFAAGAAATPAPRARSSAAASGSSSGLQQEVIYPRGPVAGLPDELASRRERFAELDSLQPGWTVELCRRGDGAGPLDAVFFSPSGARVGAFAAARRMALGAHKEDRRLTAEAAGVKK